MNLTKTCAAAFSLIFLFTTLFADLQEEGYYSPISADDKGPLYYFSEPVIDIVDYETFPPILLEEIVEGTPAYAGLIRTASDQLLEELKKLGHPLAEIIEEELVADEQEALITVIVRVKAGPKARFGPLQIDGDKTVLKSFIENKVTWQIGDPYSEIELQKTLCNLEATGLFSSLSLQPNLDECNGDLVPLVLHIEERKHRSVGFGIGFTTELGVGLSGEWEHRNIGGTGQKLSFKTNLWQKWQEGTLSFLTPDFLVKGQDFISSMNIQHIITEGFREQNLTLSAILERQLTLCQRASFGLTLTQLKNSHSDNNRSFTLLKTPFQWRLNRANDLLDPTSGYSIHLKMTPTMQLANSPFVYFPNVATATFYTPLLKDDKLVLASKMTFGTIIGSNRHQIPPSERFYAGSESLLRGYKFMTVSPLDKKHKPIGGRSMLVTSFELRARLTESIGLAAFYDIGNVYSESMPNLNEKWLQSAGFGLRYHTPVGPLRLDFAFPLNRRKKIDPPFQFYFNIGQAF